MPLLIRGVDNMRFLFYGAGAQNSNYMKFSLKIFRAVQVHTGFLTFSSKKN